MHRPTRTHPHTPPRVAWRDNALRSNPGPALGVPDPISLLRIVNTLPQAVRRAALMAGVSLLTVACSPQAPQGAAPATPGSPTPTTSPAGTLPSATAPKPNAPAVSVTTVKAQRRDLAVVVEATGSIAPRRTVDVRSQVGATVREVMVREGQVVAQGQLLFRLDDRNEKAQLERARAQLLRDEAALADAQRQLQRAQELQRQNFVSQGAVDAAQTNAQTLSAAAAASRAAVQAAEVALSLMTIAAPQPGRLGSIAVHPGAYVAPGAAPLVNISEVHPVLVVFSVPQRHLAAALQAQASGQAAVEVMASDGPPSAAGKPEMAPIVFVDSAIDAATGTVRLKAELDNRSSRWWPGAYVKIQMRLQNLKDATVVPLAAIVQGARGRTVFVVDSEGLAQPRSVELIDAAEGWAAVKGIEPDSTLVLEGRQNLRAGTKVIDRSAGAGK